MATPSIRRPDLPAGLSYEKPVTTGAVAPALPAIARPALPEGLSYEPPAPAAAPTLQQPRSWGRAVGDLGVGLAEGAVSAGLAIPQLVNTLSGGAIDEAWKPLTGAVDRLAGGPGEGRTLAQSSQDTRAALDELKSPQLREAEQSLAQTKGFIPSAKAILTNPMLLGQQVAEQVPQFIVPAGAARKVGASVLEKVGAEALAKGTAKRVAAGLGEQEAAKLAMPAANRLAQRAASKAAGRAVMATGGAIGASQASEQAQQEVMGLDQSVMDANPEYRQLRAQGLSDADARQKLAITAGMKAAAIALPFDTLTSGLSARLEGNIFRGQTGVQGLSQLLSKRGAAGVAKAAGKEGAEETLQEGGEQFAQNVGVQGVDPNKSLMDQVPEQAALGGTIGAVLGAGGFAGSSALSRPSVHAAPPGSLTDAANVLSRPANGPIARAAQEGVANGAVAAAAQQAPAQAEAPSAQSTRIDPGMPPWADTSTGELANPSPADLIRALADHMVAQHQATGDMRINPQQIAEAWGVPKGAVERTRKAATTRASDQLAAAERAAMAPPAAPAPEPTPEPGTTASIPFMITQQMRADLRALGHTDAEIAGMTPEQANTLLQAGQSVATAPQETTHDERVPEPAPAAPAGTGAEAARAADEQPAAGGEPQQPAGSAAAAQPAPDSATAVAGERPAADAGEALITPSKEAPADAETPASAAPAPGPGGNPAAVAGEGGEPAAGAAETGAPAAAAEAPAEPKAKVARAPKAPKGRAAAPANHVHAAIQRIAEGEHPEKVLAEADEATVRAVGAAMGKRFSTKAPLGAMVERIGETAASDRRRLAADALVKMGRQKAAEAPPLQPVPSPAPRSTQSVAARKAESLRVKTPTGEVNGRSHVDHLIKDGYTHLTSTRAGDKLVHSLAKADGTSEKIHARQLAYAQERLAVPAEQPAAAPAPATADKRQQIEKGFAENKAAIVKHKFKAGDAVTFTQNGKTITGTIAKGDKAGMVKDMGVFQVEHPGRNGTASNTIGARFLSHANPAPKSEPVKWFGDREKAQRYLAKQKLADTHEIVVAGKRFEIHPKAEASATPTEAAKGDDRFAGNTIFTADKVAAARARLKAKLGTVNAGIDPEVLLDGLTIAGAYIESGARSFSAYAKAMINDLGDGVRPFLRSFYESVRHYPGFDAAGMSTPAEAERLHAQLAAGSAAHPAIGEKPQPAARKQAAARKAGAPIDRTLTQDWGVESVDGYTALPGAPGTRTDSGLQGGVKDAFLKEAKGYLQAVSDALIRGGYREHEGKGRPVSVNESGPAGSGDVTLTLRQPGGDGVYVHVSATALRGMVPSSKQGISVMFRAAPEGDKYGTRGVNQWAPTDLTAGELADLIKARLNSRAATAIQAVTDEHPATPASRAEPTRPAVGNADSQGSAPAGKGQLGASKPESAPADTAGVDAGQPADDGATQGDQSELPDRSGARAAGADVGDAEGADRKRNGSDGRARAGGARNADAGAGKPDGSGRSGRGAGRDTGSRAAVADPEVVKPPAEVSPANPGAGNYHMADPLAVVGGGPVARFNKNQAAIELYNTLRDESRKPTAEEQAVLAGYTGWGSFGQELFQGSWSRPQPKDGWQARDAWLRENLGQSEWESIQRSITNAHYTDPPTVMAMWKMVQRMGFTGGRVLEPSMGIGNFFAMMPRELADRSKLSGIELDEVTGGMAKLLYPDANVRVMGYQDSKTPDSFHDVIIGNWPFENTPVADRRYQRLNPMVHDYFFLKAMDQVRPGGLVVGITSKGTMDKKAVGIRAELARKGELVAAYRLPSGAFEEYAGTGVVTDIIILRKRAEPIGNPMGEGWIDAKEYMTPQGEPVFLNEYYHAHPENVIGTIEYGHGTTHGRAGMIVTRPADMQAQLERIVAAVPEGAYRADTRADHISYVTNHTKDREGSLTASAGKFYVVRGEQLAPAEQVRKYSGSSKAETTAREDQLHRLIGMRQQYAALIEAERTQGADAAAARKALKASYDRFVKDHGQLNQSFGLDYLRRIDDPFYYSLAALEIQTSGRGKTAKYRPAQILTESTTRASAVVKNPTITDAFVIARNRAVNPTLDEIAAIAGKTPDQVRAELIGKGTIYELPGGDIVPADIYLSGNVREKLRQARAAVEVEGNTALQRNVDALEKVVPADIPYYKIETQFGATWVSIDNYKAYIAHMLGTDSTDGIDVSYNAGRWRVRLDDKLKNRPEYRANFGTAHTGFRALVQAAISNQTITIRTKDRDGNMVADPEKTKEVTEKIANIRGSFSDWLWSDPERKVSTEREYNEVRNAYATPHFDGSFLGFEGMALSLGRGPFDLREHQRNAIWRALVTRKSLNAHEVGTGKTFTMGGIAVESRRYGIAKKPLLLAHNANSKSVAAEIQQMYPAAKVLYIDNLAPDTIDVKLRQIANDDWDTIVMPHSLIDRLSFKEETLMGMAKEEIAELEQAAAEAAEDDGTKLTAAMLDDEDALKKLRSPTAKELVKMRNRIIATIKKQSLRASREGAIAFEDLGIDQLLVDEAHEFKKPPFSTKMKMKGLQTQASDKAIALSFMSKYVRSNNNGGNVHLFTGTPVTNTMTEVFHMMRYIMQEEMQSAGVDQWDGWFGSFAREVQDVELNAAAEYEAVTRLAAFINVPELRRMIGQYMDVVFSDDMPEMQPRRTASGKTMADALDPIEQAELLNGRTEGAQDRPYKKVVIDTADLTPAQASAFEQIQGYAKGWRNFTKKQRKEAMLAGAPESPIIYEGLANKASLDSRLLHGEALAGQEGKARDDAGSKASRVVKNVLEIYHSHPLANQVIFSDLGMGTVATRSVGEVGKKTQQRYKVFSTLRDVIERLVDGGIPREQIALVDGSTSKDKRKEIADKVNTGAIRVVIGSSGSLGVGVNMQRNLRAMHHLDAPWMPGDLEQRNGRGQRQGNQWNTVLEYRYLTDRLDGRRWQVLAIKDRFIKSFLKANDTDRVIEGDAASDEQSDILQTFSEAAGDPRILIREKIKKKIEALQSKERLHSRAMADNQATIRKLAASVETQRQRLAAIERDGVEEKAAAIVAKNAGKGFSIKVDGKNFDKRADANEAIKDWVVKNVVAGQRRVTVGEYGGHRLFARLGSFDPEPRLSMEFGDSVIEAGGSLSSLDMALRNFAAKVQKQQDDLASTEQSLDRMKKTGVEPFHMADQLAAQQKALTDLERDIAINPVPPPAWLRQGAPVDTETFWKGKPYTVTGHRWTDEGWYVMGEGPQGEAQIPYTEAKDRQGIAQYEERPFQSPKVLTEAERKAAEAEGLVKSENDVPSLFRLEVAAPTVTRGQEAHAARIRSIATAAVGKWKGDDVPRLEVVATPEQLPPAAKRDANGDPDDTYKNAAGMYDGKTIYIVASRHAMGREGLKKLLTTMAHEGVGHYGMDRIVDRELGAGAWTKIEDAADRLRQNPDKASPAIRAVLAELDKRYPDADRKTYAREFMAVTAERGVKNGLLDRVVSAIRRWLRRVLPDLRLSEHELRQLVVASDRYLRVGETQQQRVQSRAALAFSTTADPTRTPQFKQFFGDWERLAVQRRLDATKPVDITVPAAWRGEPIERLRAHVADALDQMVHAQTVIAHPQLGDIHVGRKGAKKTVSTSRDPAKMLVVADLANALPKAVPSGFVASAEQGVKGYSKLLLPVRIDGAEMVAIFTVRHQADGQWYYNTVTVADKKMRPGSYESPGALARPLGETPITGLDAFVRRDLQRVNPDEVSKVVDAAGNPLVLYHGTAEDFSVFGHDRAGEATGHATSPLGHFFTPDRAQAAGYARNASEGRPADERVVDAYLAIRNPYTMTLKQAQAIETPAQARAIRAKLEAEGYDGIRLPQQNAWVAFHSEQIKSASGNRGTFDSSNPNIYFSRDDADPDNPNPTPRPFGDASASIETMQAELPQLDRSAYQKAKDWVVGKARDFEPAALGALQLRHVLELAADDPTLKAPAKAYADLYQRMDGDRNQMQQTGAEKVDALQKWARTPGAAGWLSGKLRPEARQLFKFMHAVTQLAVDPTNAYEKLLMRDSHNEYKPWTKDLIKERKKVLREAALSRSGDDKTRILDELKELDRLPQRERVRAERYPKLVAQWNALSPEAKHHFEVMRDHYQEQSTALEEATVQQLQSLDIPDQNKRTAIQMVRNNFRDAKVDGVYFPLTRFGDYWISLRKKDGEYVFAKYETANAMVQAEKQWLAAGATIEARGRQDNNYRAKDAPSGTFIGDLMGILKNAPDKTKDEIYQMYLKTLPALSLRKHGIHRNNVAGYSDDVPRAFAGSVFHGAHQISKARYGWRLQSTMEQMRERMEARRTTITAAQAAHGDALLGELARRHDWVMNPTNSQLASQLTSIGFTYYLAASPASALVNLIQVPQIVLPVLGAQHGWGRATRVLTATMRDAIRTGGHIDKVLTGEDLQAFKALAEQGTFQRSAAHALASISEGDQLRASPLYTRVMNAVSWMFHTSEVINREGTGMAAFRLARAKGMAFDAAVKYADEITNGTHGDYSNANRARYMQGNTMKVLTQFKNYSLAMSWLWGRQFHQAFKGESPEVRATARRTLTGLLGMTGLFAGVVGMPIFNLLRYGAMAAHAVTGDPDEPWDFMTEFRAWLSEHLGDTAADLIANGAASQLGANVASRVSMSDLWFRDADRQLEGEDAYNAMLQILAGPLGGMIKNMYVGAQQFNEGHTQRGIETMLPTFAKNAVKSVRYASQGVNTLRGDPIVADISGPEALIQAIGFQPTRVAKQQRLNNSLYTYQQAIKDRRQALMNGFAMAQQAGDVDGRVEALRRIRAFNAKNPEVAIGIANLRASLQGRARFSADASHGIRLDKKLAARLRQEVGASP